jgi:hypothetical protein
MNAARAGNQRSPVCFDGITARWRKLTGKSSITEADALAILKAVELADDR